MQWLPEKAIEGTAGLGLTVKVQVAVALQLPGLLTVRVTVYVPGWEGVKESVEPVEVKPGSSAIVHV